MKVWNFKIKEDPKELSKKIESALGSVNGLVFNIDHTKNDSVAFKMRKRILYPWYLFFLNSLVVNGRLSKEETDKETNVEISFKQHFLWILVIIVDIILGLAFIASVISEKNNNAFNYLIGTIILAIGIILWLRIQKKYETNVKEYKLLISKTFGI